MPARRFALSLALWLILSNSGAAETFQFQGRVDVIPVGTASDRSSATLAPGSCTYEDRDADEYPSGSTSASGGIVATVAPMTEDSANAQIARTSGADPATTEQNPVQLRSCVVSVVYE